MRNMAAMAHTTWSQQWQELEVNFAGNAGNSQLVRYIIIIINVVKPSIIISFKIVFPNCIRLLNCLYFEQSLYIPDVSSLYPLSSDLYPSDCLIPIFCVFVASYSNRQSHYRLADIPFAFTQLCKNDTIKQAYVYWIRYYFFCFE